MKTSVVVVAVVAAVLFAGTAGAGEDPVPTAHHHPANETPDTRISLGVPEGMKQHQLRNMRGHVEAVAAIVGLLAEKKFDDAAAVAHAKLGLNPEMKAMCGIFNNADFERLGLAFHGSGDALGDALQTRDVDASLRALNTTLGYCVQCHSAFRQ